MLEMSAESMLPVGRVQAEKPVKIVNPLAADLVKFQDLIDHSLIDGRVMKAIIHDMKFENMTEVQSKTIRETLKGVDV